MSTLENHGIEDSPDKVMLLMKVSYSHLIDYCTKKYKITEEFISEYKRTKKAIELSEAKPFPHISDVCLWIHQNGGKNYLYTHRGESSLELLKKHGLYDLFTGFITKDDNFKRKPHPEAIQFIIEQHRLEANQVIMVGDRDIDILAGKNAGVKTCYFNLDQTPCQVEADHEVVEVKGMYGL